MKYRYGRILFVITKWFIITGWDISLGLLTSDLPMISCDE
jgi:hypothetical protein